MVFLSKRRHPPIAHDAGRCFTPRSMRKPRGRSLHGFARGLLRLQLYSFEERRAVAPRRDGREDRPGVAQRPLPQTPDAQVGACICGSMCAELRRNRNRNSPGKADQTTTPARPRFPRLLLEARRRSAKRRATTPNTPTTRMRIRRENTARVFELNSLVHPQTHPGRSRRPWWRFHRSRKHLSKHLLKERAASNNPNGGSASGNRLLSSAD